MATETPKQQAKITLYWLEKSRSHRILWLLEELGIEYELKTFKRLESRLAPPELKKIHPLGKSPVITVQADATSEPIVIAESGLITEYLIEHFGPQLAPKRYGPGKEGQVGGETAEWLRYKYFLHYAEGSVMPLLIVALILGEIRGPSVPFFIRPITGAVASGVDSAFLKPSFANHLNFIEEQLATSPQNGKFLAGPELSGADIMMIFPLEVAPGRSGLTKEKYPKILEYVDMIHNREAYKRAIKKVEDATGEKFSISL
ncbi:glutathione S-transferase [Microthyrium microscopicum]|uniref:glutathione transferase n=1 Tax=Microthyrium microscopicum TaxID=703497 RepID=A0A6A6UQF2_9PEZI|nr:glutathione S-transferase [Microthyrium microscopicum]